MLEEKLTNLKGSRGFIAAILVQAFNDAIVASPKTSQAFRDKRSAIAFIDHNNDMFVYYCNLLDLDPEYMASQMQKQIRTFKFKPIKEFRE